MNKKEVKILMRLSEICFTNERDGLHSDTFDDIEDEEMEGTKG